MSTSFDAAATEIYPALLAGATLVLIPSAEELLGADIIQFCEEKEISVLHLPTDVWHHLVDDLETKNITVKPPLRLVEVGGETVDASRYQKWSELLEEPIGFINAYGPTEATVATTLFETLADKDGAKNLLSLPIGRVLPNLTVYVLDRDMQPVPIGIPGELWIGGEGVARGYLYRPQLTAERFIPDPFAYEAGARLYRTGDYVKYLPDGNLEFVGRTDNQIKIRGFRVELGEIESIVNSHPQVGHCVVLALEGETSQKSLAAYITPKA